MVDAAIVSTARTGVSKAYCGAPKNTEGPTIAGHVMRTVTSSITESSTSSAAREVVNIENHSAVRDAKSPAAALPAKQTAGGEQLTIADW
jgi:hypothetical protein